MSLKISGSVEVSFAGQTLALLPDRAIWWAAQSTVIVADVHVGKAASFRKIGLPVPSGGTAKDLSRLTALLDQTGAKRLVMLGDFLHSRAGRQEEVSNSVAAWRAAHRSLDMLLIRGNHDRSAGRLPEEWKIEQVEEPFEESGLALAHDPDCEGKLPTLAGHVHPVVSLWDFDGSSVTVPCFVIEERCGILPAFGTFTGGHHMRRDEGRRIFIVAGKRVVLRP